MKTGCAFCGHKELQPRQTQYIYRYDGKFLIVDDVPCLQCTYCGEQYFEGQVLRDIEKRFNELHVQGQKASKGVNIIAIFREIHNNVSEFEQRYDVQLPEDIAAMLTQG